MKFTSNLLTPLAAAAVLGLAACGGGGGGGSTPSGSGPAPTGTMNVQITDGPSDEFQHVWVTITGISFHTDPNAQWSASDATWQTTTLAAPVTIDLTQLTNGQLNTTVFAGLTLPVGSYRQIRLFLADANAALTSSAFAVKDSNGTALQWNDQVEYFSGTTVSEAPLEIALPTQGIQLAGTFNVSQGSTLSLAVDFDLEHDVVPFNHDGGTYFTMRPNLHYFDMSQVGAITGKVDPSQICAPTPQAEIAATTGTPNCAFNLIVKAELVAPDNSRHYVARQTTVDPLTGNFALYPLATKDASGNPIASYDIILRGREMETMLVTAVPVTAGTSPTNLPTVIGPQIELTLNNAEYTAQFQSPLAPLTGGWVAFQQTAAAGGLPYEIRWRNTDPFAGPTIGMFRNPIALQGASSSLHVASYTSSATPWSFLATTPVEGAGAYTVADNEVAYYNLSPGSVMSAPTSGTTQTFVPGTPTLASEVQSGSIAVALSFSGITNDDRCEFVVARFASVIDTVDCSAALATGNASFSVTGLGAGSASANLPGAVYYSYVRLWKAGDDKPYRVIAPLSGFLDFRTSSAPLTVLGSIVGK